MSLLLVWFGGAGVGGCRHGTSTPALERWKERRNAEKERKKFARQPTTTTLRRRLTCIQFLPRCSEIRERKRKKSERKKETKKVAASISSANVRARVWSGHVTRLCRRCCCKSQKSTLEKTSLERIHDVVVAIVVAIVVVAAVAAAVHVQVGFEMEKMNFSISAAAVADGWTRSCGKGFIDLWSWSWVSVGLDSGSITIFNFRPSCRWRCFSKCSPAARRCCCHGSGAHWLQTPENKWSWCKEPALQL